MPPLPIPSPYNFVPLSDKVYFPEWASQVSHDVPFSDGISGWFEIEVRTLSPIFIRGGAGEVPKPGSADRIMWFENDDYLRETKEFFRVCQDGPFAIPATTLKGMIRSVLEIASFGKMQPVADHRYSIRDLNAKDSRLYREHLTEFDPKTKTYSPKVHAGWLTRNEDGKWAVEPCEFARVEHEELRRFHSSNMELGDPRPKNADEHESPWKYQRWTGRNDWSWNALTIAFDSTVRLHDVRPGVRLQYPVAQNLGGGGETGTLVFTGQPSSRLQKEGGQILRNGNGSPLQKRHVKHLEFVFYSPKHTAPVQPVLVPDTVQRDFDFVHRDPDGTPNPAWGYWLSRWPTIKRIPVFFQPGHDDSEKTVVSKMGLAMMFRLAYDRSIGEVLDIQQPLRNSPAPDLVELIFGTTGGGKNNDLRGRVQFEPAIIDGPAEGLEKRRFENSIILPKVKAILGSPKPSYYPNYLEQNIVDGQGHVASETIATMEGGTAEVHAFKTFMSPDARLRGWKRYPVSQSHTPFVPEQPGLNAKTATVFFPLGSPNKDCPLTFRGRVNIHNLRPGELGALFWALTWGGNEQLCHRIGLAKAYGYGEIKVSVKSMNNLLQVNDALPNEWKKISDADIASFRKLFSDNMERWWRQPPQSEAGSWIESEQLHQLLAMADPAQSPGQPGSLTYPILDPMAWPQRINDFADYKTEGAALLPYAKSIILPAQVADPVVMPQLPDLIGQKHRVSYKTSKTIPQKQSRTEVQELWFTLKHQPPGKGEEKFDAVLRNPIAPKLCGPLKNGDFHVLFVVGIEGDKYVLAESQES